MGSLCASVSSSPRGEEEEDGFEGSQVPLQQMGLLVHPQQEPQAWGPGFSCTTSALCPPEQVTYLLWASVSSSVKWACSFLPPAPPSHPRSIYNLPPKVIARIKQDRRRAETFKRSEAGCRAARGVTVAVCTALKKSQPAATRCVQPELARVVAGRPWGGRLADGIGTIGLLDDHRPQPEVFPKSTWGPRLLGSGKRSSGWQATKRSHC